MKMDSLRARYFVKLVKAGSDALINLLMLLFVPRILGPANYGSFNFLRDAFQNIVALSDLNLGAAYLNQSARKRESGTATDVYFSYTLLVGLVLVLFVAVVLASGLDAYLFPGQLPEYVALGAALAYLMYLYNALMGLSDAKVATYGFELRCVGVNVILFAGLLLMFAAGALDLASFFAQRMALYLCLVAFGAWYLSRKIGFRPRPADPRRPEVRAMVRSFFAFSHPLIALSAFGIVLGLADRWLLQWIYGSESQGYFSLAFSLSSIASLFLAPMTPLLMQSVAKADESGDMEGVRVAFDKVKILYLIGAFLSIFFMFHTDEIVALIGGRQYESARLTVLVMFFYPIHVVYGQFCGGVLIALRKTGVYRNVAMLSSSIGVLLTYFLLAPTSFPIPGLELGPFGLALKLVLAQLLSVTVQLHYVCRYIGAKTSHYLLSQLVIPLPVVIAGGVEWLLRRQVTLTLEGTLGSGLSLAVSILLWITLLGGLFWRFPALAGLQKEALRGALVQARSAFAARFRFF